MAVKPIPEGYPRVSPYLAVDGAAKAIDFYVEVFGGKERMRMPGPDGKIGHAEVELGDSVIMLADEFPDMGHKGPKSLGGTPISLAVYVEDVDKVVDHAVTKGATILQPVEDKFYGDRAGMIEDPFGHHWSVMTHIEDVPPEEMGERAAKAMQEMGG